MDWAAVRRDYDYVWVYDFPDWDSQLVKIGHRVYTAEKLSIYAVDRTVPRP